MAYGVCSEEKHVYELKDGKKTESALTGPGKGLLPDFVAGTGQYIRLLPPEWEPFRFRDEREHENILC